MLVNRLYTPKKDIRFTGLLIKKGDILKLVDIITSPNKNNFNIKVPRFLHLATRAYICNDGKASFDKFDHLESKLAQVLYG